MKRRVKIRGIYSTALTRLVLDGGYQVVQSSPRLRERFALTDDESHPELTVHDRDDLQGIELTGESELIYRFWAFLQERLRDAALLDLEMMDEPDGTVRAVLEFPGESKEALDSVRASVLPTLSHHHRLRIIESKLLELRELALVEHPEAKPAIESKLFQDAILLPLQKSGMVRLEHARPGGKPIRPREGALLKIDSTRIVFRRAFSEGRYDGLDLPIERGDYGVTECSEGSWYVRHRYYSHRGELKGEYCNINTPVELYPFGARYMDLEIDVVRRKGERPFLLDREKLAFHVRDGRIGASLERKALEVAEMLMKRLTGAAGEEHNEYAEKVL